MRLGELCAGYGGLGMGVARVLDVEPAWFCEVDKAASRIRRRDLLRRSA